MAVSAEKVRVILKAFLEREKQSQGGRTLRLTSNIRRRIMALASGDLGRSLGLEAWLKTRNTVGDIDEFVDQVLRRIPSNVSDQALQGLRAGSGDKPAGRMGRLGKLVSRTEAAGEPESVLRMRDSLPFTGDEKDRAISESVTGQKTLKVPALRLGRIAAGLPDAWVAPEKKEIRPEARFSQSLEKVIASIDRNLLTPADARGTPQSGEYADAREFARSLARELDITHQQGKSSISMNLGDGYLALQDRGLLFKNLQVIHRKVRAALPENAANVARVEIYFGKRPVTALTK